MIVAGTTNFGYVTGKSVSRVTSRFLTSLVVVGGGGGGEIEF